MEKGEEVLVEKVKTAVETLKKTLESMMLKQLKDTEELTKPLMSYRQHFISKMKDKQTAGATDSAEAKKSDDNIVDAEVVDEDKKRNNFKFRMV